jgi:hypothetical protein
MRHVNIIERLNETYSYATIDQQTGEVPLRLTVWCSGGQFRTNRISPQTNRERTGERHGYRPGNRAKRRLG